MPTPSEPASHSACGERPAAGAAVFRFYAELNDFISADRRQRDFAVACAGDANLKHVIEALGVPHTEVEMILVNGRSVDFSERLRAGDRVSVYPKFEALDVTPLLRLRPQPLRVTRFIADAHLGALARLLRMAGFDTLYDNDRATDDDEIERIAEREGRIILSRDRELLKRRSISHGCYVHAIKPDLQFNEVINRLDLAGSVRPLALCLDCNAPLAPVAKAEVLHALPAGVRDKHERFSTCAVCRRVFWEGSHWRRMRERIAQAVAPPPLAVEARALAE
jgi:uncharacterized protein with PIN domain